MAELNVLGELTGEELADDDRELLCLKAIHHAAKGDPRWAAWYLEHSPSTSSSWSDLAVQYRIEKDIISRLFKAIIAFGFNPAEEQRFLMHLRAEGIETVIPGLKAADDTAEAEG